jgi:hypothetical protein
MHCPEETIMTTEQNSQPTGTLLGTVTNGKRVALIDATVTLTGSDTAPQVQVTDPMVNSVFLAFNQALTSSKRSCKVF